MNYQSQKASMGGTHQNPELASRLSLIQICFGVKNSRHLGPIHNYFAHNPRCREATWPVWVVGGLTPTTVSLHGAAVSDRYPPGMAAREGVRRVTARVTVTVAVWGLGLVLILVFGETERPSFGNDEAKALPRMLEFLENAPSDGPLLQKLRASVERIRGLSPGDLEGTAWREDVAQTWRDKDELSRGRAQQAHSRAQQARTRAWRVVGGGWTVAVCGLYFLAGWVRKGFDGTDSGSDRS